MTNEQKILLSQIFNTLMTVNTSGENSFIMTDCLRAMQKLMVSINESEESKEAE